MLSILIPCYNFDCLRLVTDLQLQCEELQAQYGATFDYEILVADDASTDAVLVERCQLMDLLPHCQYVQMEKRVGRALLCNWLFAQARFAYLLLIDADAEVVNPDFISTYWAARNKAAVLVGGLLTPRNASSDCALRHRYELAADARRTIAFRQAHPYEQFTTFNVWMARSVVEQLQFDERCVEYGYEDALFGLELERRGYEVCHLHNPLLHTGINNSLRFLDNTEAALRNLLRLGEPLASRSGVVRLHRRLQRWGVLSLARWCFYLLKPCLRAQLLSASPSLHLFAFYKWGVYAQYLEEKPIG